MDLANAVRRTHQAQQSLDEKMDRLLAIFSPSIPAAEQGEGEPITGETPEVPVVDISTLLIELNAKLDLVLEALAGLQPATKKKTTKADPPPDETTGPDGGQ